MKKEIYTEKAPKPIGPYSQGMKVGNLLYTAGQVAIDPESGEVKASDIREETTIVMNHLKSILEEAEMTMDNVIKCGIFLKDMNDFAVVNEVYGTFFDRPFPVRETVEVSRLPKDVNVEISLIASTD